MKYKRLIVITAGVASVVAAVLAISMNLTAKAPPAKVRIATSARGSSWLYLYVAQSAGMFQQNGLDVELVEMDVPNIPAALVQGEVQFTGAAQTAHRAALSGLPIRAIAVAQGQSGFALVADNSIQSLGDLKGKKLATGSKVSAYGGTVAELLRGVDLNPNIDLDVLYLGNLTTIPVLLKKREVNAALIALDAAVRVLRENPDLHLVAGPAEMPTLPFSGLATTTNVLQGQPAVVEGVVRSVLQAVAFMKAQPQKTEAIIGQWLDTTPEDSRRVYELMTPTYVPDGQLTDALATIEARLSAQVLDRPNLTTADIRSVYDTRLAAKVARELGVQG